MDNKIIYAILAIAVTALVVSGMALLDRNGALGSSSINSFSGTMRNGSVAITSTTVAVATSTTRAWLLIVNDGANTVYCSKAATATASEGIRLNASGGSYEINAENQYQGTISCVTSGGTVTSTLTVSEKR